ncbi:MAG TPA: hypothetical protein PLZ86_08425 [bacterium]|nr:hypothetical protein [bacterium]
MRRLLTFAVLALVAAAFLSTADARRPRKSRSYEAPDSLPAKIDNVSYVTGLPEIDVRKYSKQEQWTGWFELGEKEAAFKRKRLAQGGKRGLEEVDIVRFPYSSVTDLAFGYDAIYRAANDSLPTALAKIYNRGASYFVGGSIYAPLHEFMKQRNRSPVVVFFKRDGKLTSLVLLSSHGRAEALYRLLAKGAGIKVKEPVKSSDEHETDPTEK